MSIMIRGFLMLVLGGWMGVGVAQEGDPGEGYFQRGQFELAVHEWEANRSSLSVGQLPGLATAYQQLGRLREAWWVWKETLVDQNPPTTERTGTGAEVNYIYQ